jgi:hypothetical protein
MLPYVVATAKNRLQPSGCALAVAVRDAKEMSPPSGAPMWPGDFFNPAGSPVKVDLS